MPSWPRSRSRLGRSSCSYGRRRSDKRVACPVCHPAISTDSSSPCCAGVPTSRVFHVKHLLPLAPLIISGPVEVSFLVWPTFGPGAGLPATGAAPSP